MNEAFHRMMVDATRLTRAGDLRAATAAIQAALHGAMAREGGGIGPVDVANVVDVIDVEARELDVPGDPHAPNEAAEEAGRFIAGRHNHPAGTRDYKLYVPPGYRGRPLPLVVMLHGCKQHPDDFAAGTRMNEFASERGFFVLYPAQAQNANASRCWNWFKHNHQGRGRGEPALLADMTRDVIKRYGVDAKRVYVAGLSAGGAMAAILGDAYPDVYAAVGVHSGLRTAAATNLKSALEAMRQGATAPQAPSGTTPPTIVFHGDRDATVHPVNGEHVIAARVGASEPERERVRSANGRECTRQVYRDVEGRVVAEHWIVHGGGHAWSGGSVHGSYCDPKGPDASDEMLRFFFERTLREAT